MKDFCKLFGMCLCLFINAEIKSQQDPYFTHFKYNKQAYNPASLGGSEESICVSSIAHQQWLNFDDQTFRDQDRQTPQPLKDVAPVTYNFNIATRIKIPSKPFKLALGMTLLNDKVGFFQTTEASFQGAIILKINKESNLSLGTSLGFFQYSHIHPKYRAISPLDPRIPKGIGSSDGNLNINLGVHYRRNQLFMIRSFYTAFSATHVNQPIYSLDIDQNSNFSINQKAHFYMNSGGRIPITYQFALEPAILLKYNSKPQIDLNCTGIFQETFRGGFGYRQWGNIDALSILVGYQVNGLQVGYSYDFTTSSINQVSNGSHELMLAYCFKKKPTTDSLACIPRKEYTWPIRNTRHL